VSELYVKFMETMVIGMRKCQILVMVNDLQERCPHSLQRMVI